MSTILLVEDDAALRDGLTELFTREGYSVTTAANAAEARQNFSVYIDLIILDVTLPDGNGVSLCQEWRDQGITTSILFLTAKDEEFDVVRGLDAGGNDYVTKPFRMMELLSRIRALLRRTLGVDAASLQIVNRPPTRSKPLYMKVWEARKADGLDYDPDDERQQRYLSEITRYNLTHID